MRLKIIIGMVVSFVFLYFTFRQVDFQEMLNAIKAANYLWLIPAFATMIFSHWLRAVRWRYLLEPIKLIKINPVFSALMIGYAANNIFPLRMGEFLRAFAIGKSQKISKSSAFATVFVERFILDFVPLLLVLVLTFSLFASILGDEIKYGGYLISVITCFVIALVIVLIKWTDATVEKLRQILPAKLFKFVEHFLPSFTKGCLAFKKAEHYLAITVLSVLVWALYILSIYFSFFIFDFPAKYGLDISASLLVLVFASFGIMIPASPGYVGTFHYFCALSLNALGAGIPDGEVKSFALVSHLMNILPISIIGLFYFWRENLHFSDAVAEKELVEHPQKEEV
ncbi:flippase-like domain-containing protein [candidate division KSB1 bacterium]|nr:flippase-like domain-containing protein [candidate division KSB1 bacterium]